MYLPFTDASYFTRGVFKIYNLRMWQNKSNDVVHQSHHQYRFSVGVWAGIVDNYLVGPYLMLSRCFTRYF